MNRYRVLVCASGDPSTQPAHYTEELLRAENEVFGIIEAESAADAIVKTTEGLDPSALSLMLELGGQPYFTAAVVNVDSDVDVSIVHLHADPENGFDVHVGPEFPTLARERTAEEVA